MMKFLIYFFIFWVGFLISAITIDIWPFDILIADCVVGFTFVFVSYIVYVVFVKHYKRLKNPKDFYYHIGTIIKKKDQYVILKMHLNNQEIVAFPDSPYVLTDFTIDSTAYISRIVESYDNTIRIYAIPCYSTKTKTRIYNGF